MIEPGIRPIRTSDGLELVGRFFLPQAPPAGAYILDCATLDCAAMGAN